MTQQQNFTAQVDQWVRETEQRLTAVFRESAREVVTKMQEGTPVGVTGFLRASMQVNLNGPVPMTRENPGSGKFTPPTYALVIAGADLGDTIWATYGANYAGFVEYGTSKMTPRAFVRLAAMQWPQIVAQVTGRAKAAVAASGA